MTNTISGAEQLVQQLEVLLHTARAAAAGLQARAADDESKGAADVGPPRDDEPILRRLSLFSLVSQSRNGTERFVVQLQAGDAIYEGAAATVDFAEPRLRAVARAALAAVAEAGGNDREFAIGDVAHVSLNCGPALLVTVGVRPAPPVPDTRALAAFLGSTGTSETERVETPVSPSLPPLQAFPSHGEASVHWLVGCALEEDDPAHAVVRAVLNAVEGTF